MGIKAKKKLSMPLGGECLVLSRQLFYQVVNIDLCAALEIDALRVEVLTQYAQLFSGGW